MNFRPGPPMRGPGLFIQGPAPLTDFNPKGIPDPEQP
jgi:hypothetical protein